MDGSQINVLNKSSQLTKIKQNILHFRKQAKLDLSDGLVVKNLPANVEDTSLIPAPERFHRPRGNKAYLRQLLRLQFATTEVYPFESPHSATREAITKCLHTPTRESPPAAMMTQHKQNLKKRKNKQNQSMVTEVRKFCLWKR